MKILLKLARIVHCCDIYSQIDILIIIITYYFYYCWDLSMHINYILECIT